MIWRYGSKVPINVYDGNRPVCQCQTVADAKLIVTAVNAWKKANRGQKPAASENPDTPLPGDSLQLK